MSIFVYDYDYNAPTPEYLKETHERGYKTIREKHPDLPIIFISTPHFDYDETYTVSGHEEKTLRRTIIMETYINAVRNGDKNVYYIDGSQFFANDDSGSCLIDGCHPTDIGFAKMAETIGAQIDAILRRLRR